MKATTLLPERCWRIRAGRWTVSWLVFSAVTAAFLWHNPTVPPVIPVVIAGLVIMITHRDRSKWTHRDLLLKGLAYPLLGLPLIVGSVDLPVAVGLSRTTIGQSFGAAGWTMRQAQTIGAALASSILIGLIMRHSTLFTERVASAAVKRDAQPIALGSFWRRGAAFLIDLALISGLTLVAMLVIGLALGLAGSGELTDGQSEGLFKGVALFIALCLYFPLCTVLWSATPGKKLFKLRVVDGSLGTGSWSRLILRESIGKAIGFCCFGHLWALFNAERRASWDFMGDTLVVSTRVPGPAAEDFAETKPRLAA